MTIEYLDGEFRQLEDIRISPLDRGFLFADGVYEVIPVYAGRLFRAGGTAPGGTRSWTGSSSATAADIKPSTCRLPAAWLPAIMRFPAALLPRCLR
jgi:hypothetical protein